MKTQRLWQALPALPGQVLCSAFAGLGPDSTSCTRCKGSSHCISTSWPVHTHSRELRRTWASADARHAAPPTPGPQFESCHPSPTHVLCRSQWPPPPRDGPPGPAPTSLSRHSAASLAGLHTSAHRAGRAAVGSRTEHGRCPTSSSIFPVALEQQRSASVSPTGLSQVTEPGIGKHDLLRASVRWLWSSSAALL